MVDGVKGELATIMNSVGYYDYSWREPTGLDWAVIQDIGWTKKTEGILSETINLSENILISHTENTISGTLNFNTGNNIISNLDFHIFHQNLNLYYLDTFPNQFLN